MQIFELKVLDYHRSTDNYVLYRVTPVFRDNDLVAAGVQMEVWSVEDEGKGICFNVFCYNVQPGIEIDYATGESKRVINIASSDENANSEDTSAPKSLKENDSSSENEDKASAEIDKQISSETEKKLDNEKNNEVETGEEKNDEGNSYEETTRDYVLNVNSHRIHLPSCKSVGDISEKNKLEYKGTLKELKDKGYTPCGRCLAEYR
jgi:DNA-entry nuclease